MKAGFFFLKYFLSERPLMAQTVLLAGAMSSLDSALNVVAGALAIKDELKIQYRIVARH